MSAGESSVSGSSGNHSVVGYDYGTCNALFELFVLFNYLIESRIY